MLPHKAEAVALLQYGKYTIATSNLFGHFLPITRLPCPNPSLGNMTNNLFSFLHAHSTTVMVIPATRIIAVATKQGWDLVLLATNGKWCLYNRQITVLAVNAAAV